MHIRLHTPTGQHHYKVVAILKDLENISRAMFIDRRSYLQDWARSSDGLFVISLEESSRPKQIAGLLQEHLSQRYKGLSWAALSFKSDLDLLMSKLLLSCRWLMVFFVLIALGLLYNLLSGAATNQLFSTLYLLGGQHHLLRRLGEHSILFTTTVIMVVSLALGTSLGYVLVGNLNPISNYWSWGLTGQSYAPTVVILFVLLMVLSRALQRAIPRFSRKLPGR